MGDYTSGVSPLLNPTEYKLYELRHVLRTNADELAGTKIARIPVMCLVEVLSILLPIDSCADISTLECLPVVCPNPIKLLCWDCSPLLFQHC